MQLLSDVAVSMWVPIVLASGGILSRTAGLENVTNAATNMAMNRKWVRFSFGVNYTFRDKPFFWLFIQVRR